MAHSVFFDPGTSPRGLLARRHSQQITALGIRNHDHIPDIQEITNRRAASNGQRSAAEGAAHENSPHPTGEQGVIGPTHHYVEFNYLARFKKPLPLPDVPPQNLPTVIVFQASISARFLSFTQNQIKSVISLWRPKSATIAHTFSS